jgi:thiamine kinase-like enzyme
MEGWSLERLADTVKMHQQECWKSSTGQEILLTWTGHGDCKPCNLILLQENTSSSTRGAGGSITTSNNMDMTTTAPHSHACIKFIDLELAGMQYVAYDLAKFWRRRKSANKDNNNEQLTSSYARNRRAFLQTYVDETTINV